MYSLTQQGNITEEQIEDSFGGNICRCTGYRPILKAFRNLANDNQAVDIEDLLCGPLVQTCLNKELLELKRKKWIKVFELEDLLKTLEKYVDNDYMLVAGNTAKGVYPPIKFPDVYIDISDVQELLEVTYDENKIIVGGNVTLHTLMNIFNEVAEQQSTFQYLKKVAKHINLVANVPVRNVS